MCEVLFSHSNLYLEGNKDIFIVFNFNISMNCIIVHGSNSTEASSKKGLPENERHWKPWLKEELEKRGIAVSNEPYPEDWAPNYEKWKKIFENNKIDKNTILIGHSAGGGFLVRWLDETKIKIKKMILVSPGKAGRARNPARAKLYGEKTINNISRFVSDGILIFTSDDDISSHIIGAKEYEKELPARIIFLKNHGHFTLGDMGTKEFPELLKEVLN